LAPAARIRHDSRPAFPTFLIAYLMGKAHRLTYWLAFTGCCCYCP